jgi:desulfoferrodoxin
MRAQGETVKAGDKLGDESGAAAIVVKPPGDGEVAFRAGDAVALGKRYRCADCNAEVLITKPGAAHLVCHGSAMNMAQPKTLPSSD